MEARRFARTLFYLSFLLSAIFLLPGTVRASFKPARLHAVIAVNLKEENSIFLAFFLLIGVLQTAHIALLLPALSFQKLSTRLFCFLGFFFGLYLSGPYLALRTPVTTLSRSALRARDQRAVESRVFGAFILAAACGSYALMAGAFGRLQASWYLEVLHFFFLLRRDRLVAAVVFDLVVSSVFAIDPLVEDMQRRGFLFHGKPGVASMMLAVSICAVPGAGLGVYLMGRPPLPKGEVKKNT